MRLKLSGPPSNLLNAEIKITGSKSESNRLLLLQALYPEIRIQNLSNSDDAIVMQKGRSIASGEVDIHHAGTAMRFLTAYFAAQEGKEVVLTGSERMKERPIKVLVEALQDLGAQIYYTNKEGYPPLHITGKKLSKHKVKLPANVSSQYISALLLIAPSLENGLELELIGEITSVPYIKMTLELLEQLGIATTFQGSVITVQPKDTIVAKTMVVESDWSSVSYFYGILALAEVGSRIVVSSYKKNSLQGDSVLADIYTQFGVVTRFEGHHLVLEKTNVSELPESSKDKSAQLEFHLANAPDIAQTIAVTCFGLGLGCHLTGLHTLKIKETDRLEALKTELTKFGAAIDVTDKDLTLEPSNVILHAIQIETYNDHRMAMAFAPLAL
ncbi:MAG: 3-phosphoshikimate 1-carboxyvinyltransferase, partial [Eudoraea sp.]|nr:3-phosphoshikimate 1-carboxyvinyltransferase [Eudoraea sp.]